MADGWRRVLWGLALWAALAAPAAVEPAEDDVETVEATPPTVVRTSDGLKFTVPPDWPIERRSGVVGPIPIEEYLARKFNALDKKIQTLEQKLISLESKVGTLETQGKKKPLHSSEGGEP